MRFSKVVCVVLITLVAAVAAYQITKSQIASTSATNPGNSAVSGPPGSNPQLVSPTSAPAPTPGATDSSTTQSALGTNVSIKTLLATDIKKTAAPITDPYKGILPVEPALPPSATQAADPNAQPLDPNKALIEPQPDGSALVDRAYRLVGKGTIDDPYIIRWDMLISAKDTFDPASGQWQVPARLRMLDGKNVQMKGYFAVPVITPTATRVLLTWNMIDVCHGVTPKPYQAIEVKLDEAMEVHPHTLEIMTMSGKFRLDPTLHTGWSMVMYMLDDAKLVAIDNPRQ
jgi:hypothetical protein